MRDYLNSVSKIKRFRDCGRVPLGQWVALRSSGEAAHSGYAGLETCGSVWACPVCSAKIAAHRQREVLAVTERAAAVGAVVSMLTLTQRHHAGQSLAELWESLSYAWNRVTSGRRWVGFKEQLGLIGWLKAVEVTHGKSGWHVHLHVLVVSEKDPRTTPIFHQRKQGRRREPYPVEVTTPGAFIADRWAAGLAAKGVDFIPHLGGIDWETARDAVAVGQYVAKMSGGGDRLAAEATLGAFKKARSGNRTPFQILADCMEKGEKSDLSLWFEWERESRGKRALTWSKGMRKWAGLLREKTDEEIAEEDLQGETVAVFSRPQWWKLRKIGAAQVLDILDGVGLQAAYDFLDYHGIKFAIPRPADESPPDD